MSGTPVDIAVRSTWVEGPTTAAPLAAGAVAALALGVVVVGRSRPGGHGRDHHRADGRDPGSGLGAAAAATGASAALALALGVVAYTSVPSETGPSPLFWFLPGVAILLAAGALVLGRRRVFAAASMSAVAALALAIWGWLRREALVRAIIPTDAPAWLDRGRHRHGDRGRRSRPGGRRVDGGHPGDGVYSGAFSLTVTGTTISVSSSRVRVTSNSSPVSSGSGSSSSMT